MFAGGSYHACWYLVDLLRQREATLTSQGKLPSIWLRIARVSHTSRINGQKPTTVLDFWASRGHTAALVN